MNAQAYLAYGCVALFFATDVILRTDGQSRALKTTKNDHHSTRFLVVAFTAVLLSAELTQRTPVGRMYRPAVAAVAVVFMFCGLVLRICAMHSLRYAYTRTLQVRENGDLVSTGIYKRIRHPGYLGTVLVWLFFGWGVGNYLVAVLGSVLVPLAYVYRIRTEERMLLDRFGQRYRDYQKQSWRLVPYLW